MKKAIFLFMTLLMCCAFLSCSKDDDPALMTIAVTAVTITEGETYAMTVGDTHTFRATVSPTNATDKSITWTIAFDTEEIAAEILQVVQRQNEVLFNRFADYIREVQPRKPIFQIDVTDIFPESDQSAMEDVLSTTDVCRALLNLAVNGNK